MTNKLDLKAIAEFSKGYSQKVCNDFFDKKNTINGSEILNLTQIDQINLFTIKALFENWKIAAESFKSSYFDFENEKVKDALQNLMNIASQHISVNNHDLQALVSKATAETIAISLNPQEYFEGIFRDMPNFKCTKEALLLMKKYNRINNILLDKISEKFGDEESVFTNQALIWLVELSESTDLDEEEIIISQLNSSYPCTADQFYKNKSKEEVASSKVESASFFDNITVPETKEKDIQTHQNIASKTIVEPLKTEKDAASTLNDKYQSEHPTVNDKLKPSTDTQNLVDLHQNAPVKNLTEHISLNQKFIFINKLFGGDSAAYLETIQILENCQSTDEALNLLMYKYAPKYHWNLNSDEADELMDILKRKA